MNLDDNNSGFLSTRDIVLREQSDRYFEFLVLTAIGNQYLFNHNISKPVVDAVSGLMKRFDLNVVRS